MQDCSCSLPKTDVTFTSVHKLYCVCLINEISVNNLYMFLQEAGGQPKNHLKGVASLTNNDYHGQLI